MKLIDAGKLLDELNERKPVEKVVQQLKELKIDIERGCVAVSNEKCNKYFDCGVCTMDRVIEIVKQGCVGTDDVCEWKSTSNREFIQNPHTKRLYSNEPSMKNVYCNTCGKKLP